jgi:hypothetical protein
MTYQIIRVRQKDIKAGEKARDRGSVYGRQHTNPVANAIHEQTSLNFAQVFDDYMCSWSQICHPKYREAHFPRSVARFIRRFDRGEKVKPFNFKLVWK